MCSVYQVFTTTEVVYKYLLGIFHSCEVLFTEGLHSNLPKQSKNGEGNTLSLIK